MGRDTVLYLSRHEVAALGVRMAEVVAAVERSLCEKGHGRAEMPPKLSLHGDEGAFSQVMAAALRDGFPDAEVGLIPSGGGVFEVSVDDRLVFSKKALGRHAQPGEIVGLVRGSRPQAEGSRQ